MQQLTLIAVGGSLGALARYGLSTFVYQLAGEIFPWGTLVVNLSGSYLIGVFIELFDTAVFPPAWRSLITIGFLGAYTTFSTYTLETVNLIRDGELRLATVNVLAGNIAGILLVFLGISSARFVLRLFS
jgi:CrcB protein